MDGCDAARESVFDFPENCSSEVDIVFHESHSAVLGPALFVVVPDYVFVVGVRVLSQKPLHQLTGLISDKLEDNVYVIDVAHIHSNGMTSFDLNRFEKHEFVLVFRRTCQL